MITWQHGRCACLSLAQNHKRTGIAVAAVKAPLRQIELGCQRRGLGEAFRAAGQEQHVPISSTVLNRKCPLKNPSALLLPLSRTAGNKEWAWRQPDASCDYRFSSRAAHQTRQSRHTFFRLACVHPMNQSLLGELGESATALKTCRCKDFVARSSRLHTVCRCSCAAHGLNAAKGKTRSAMLCPCRCCVSLSKLISVLGTLPPAVDSLAELRRRKAD